jgi:hypothetical protein
VFCCWYCDGAHAPSSSVSVSSSIVVFIFAPPLKMRLVAFRDPNFVFTLTHIYLIGECALGVFGARHRCLRLERVV